MAFDLNAWKAQLKEKLKNWRPRMQAAGVDSAYAFIAASCGEINLKAVRV